MKIKLLKLDKTVSDVELNVEAASVANLEFTYALVNRVKNQAEAQGTSYAKGRSEVKGRAAKPFKQKGTGNARQGSRKGPHFVGGGVSHGPKGYYSALTLNKKAKKSYLKAVLTDMISSESVQLFDMNGSDKDLRTVLAKTKTLVVLSSDNLSKGRTLRNMPNIKFVEFKDLGVSHVASSTKVLIDSTAQADLVKLLSK